MGGSISTRWYYDAALDLCQSFSWNAASPPTPDSWNANNFATKAHCESYCQTGRPVPTFALEEDKVTFGHFITLQLCDVWAFRNK